jgi:hypothetical protein
MTGDKVTFLAKDYRDRAIKKPATLDEVEFLRRLTLHILPRRFVRFSPPPGSGLSATQ